MSPGHHEEPGRSSGRPALDGAVDPARPLGIRVHGVVLPVLARRSGRGGRRADRAVDRGPRRHAPQPPDDGRHPSASSARRRPAARPARRTPRRPRDRRDWRTPLRSGGCPRRSSPGTPGRARRSTLGAPRVPRPPARRWRAADAEPRLARCEQALPAEALDRGEVSAFPGPPRAVDVLLAERPVHGPQVVPPGCREDRIVPLDSVHPEHLAGGPPPDHQRSSPTGRVSARRARKVLMSA